MTGRLRITPERCTGCQSCMLACSLAKEGAHSLVLSRIQVSRDEETADFRPWVCIQCAQHACVEACPTGALRVDEVSGLIRLDEESCVGCGACVTACPFQGIAFDPVGRRPLICDLCDGSPACVEACRFPQAVQYVKDAT